MQAARTVYFLIAAIGLPLATSAPAFPRDEIKLDGTVYLDEDYCAKGTGNPDCIINFAITGKAAKVLYDGMTDEGTMQECTGDVEKFDGSGMHCIKGDDANGYFCDFGYSFKKQSFGGGGDGC
jgi:hypothetical protein